jgi:AAA+ superfamily predicted ATPase
MDERNVWRSSNQQFLSAALAWLRLRLTRLARQIRPSVPAEGEADSIELGEAAEAMLTAESAEPPPALVELSRRFGLSRFERDVLLLCVGIELDTRVAGLCARAQGDPARAYPTFALALALFDEPAWDALSPEGALRYWRLIEIKQGDVEPVTSSALRADERIADYIKGLNYLDDRLTPLLAPVEVAEVETRLPASQQAVVDGILNRLDQTAAARRTPVIQLLGPDTASKHLVAWHVSTALDLQLYRLPAELLPRHAADLDGLARLWQRESRLSPVALYLEAEEIGVDGPTQGPTSPLARFLGRSEGLLFLDTRDVRPELGQPTVHVDVEKPTPAEQQAAWSAAAGSAALDSPALLTGQFNLGLAAIHEVAQRVLAEPEAADGTLGERLWEGCLAHTRPRLDTLAQRLEPKATWDDIVLPEEALDLLRQIATQVRGRSTVYEAWGFRERMNRGLGIVALFTGESGTGKTMAAEIIANDLRLNLYRIDLSAVVSKYIGETEKNLRRLFDAAEDGGAILFFDEADALFGKRSQVRDSHDRYANIEVNYLLQRMEAYRGLAILATNMRSSLDDAFTRRIRFIVNFPVPEHEDRLRIWQKVFPPQTPVEGLDLDRLASYKLTGGGIFNSALNAAFLAAQGGTPVTMGHILKAIRTEYIKSDRLIHDAEFAWGEGRRSG